MPRCKVFNTSAVLPAPISVVITAGVNLACTAGSVKSTLSSGPTPRALLKTSILPATSFGVFSPTGLYLFAYSLTVSTFLFDPYVFVKVLIAFTPDCKLSNIAKPSLVLPISPSKPAPALMLPGLFMLAPLPCPATKSSATVSIEGKLPAPGTTV